MDLIDRILNERYKVTEKIDEGGMAVVYKSTDLLLVRTVAIKVLKDRFAKDKSVLERFYREARSAAGLSYPNIISIYDIGREDDLYFIVMEYMSSGTLQDLIAKKDLSPSEVVKYGIQMCQALDYSHQKGVIHRDIKPQNVMLTEENQLKVVDFGIARAVDARDITQVGVIMGSAYYFSPEQASGKSATESSDLYSLGVMLYYMATGKHPFEGNSFAELIHKHMKGHPKSPGEINPKIPFELEKIILKAMEKKPQDRYPSALDMLNALKLCAGLFDDIDFSGEELKVEDITVTSFSVEEEVTPFFPEEYEKQLQENYETGKLEEEEIIITLDDLKNRHKSEKMARFFPLIISIFLIAAIGIMIGIIWAITRPPPAIPMVVVPDIKGRKEINARKILEQNGLFLGDIKKDYNYDYPKDLIVSQEPDMGKVIRKGSKISVMVSLGPQKVIVPYLIQKSFTDAETATSQKGLKLAVIREEYHEELKPNYVISQEPPAGTEVDGKSVVNIVISKGTEEIVIPDLTGLNKGDAEHILSIQGLNLVLAGEEPNKNIQKGLIISQDPPPGSMTGRNEPVKVILSSGIIKTDTTITVPDFTGKALKDAKSVVKSLGLLLSVQAEDGNMSEDMIIYSQYPPAGQKLKKGEAIIVRVKSKVTVVEVPDVREKLLMDAKNALKLKGLIIGDVKEIFSSEVASGTVIEQEPKSGTLLPTGSVISLIVAKAADKTFVTVPTVVGMNIDKAKSILEQNNLTVGELITQSSGEPSGTVLSQEPLSGNLVKKGTTINLMVSQ